MRWGFTGLLAWDYLCRLAVSPAGGRLIFRSGGREIEVLLAEPFAPGGKPLGEFPDELYEWAEAVQPGGGGFGSASAARLLSPCSHILYLDGGWHDEEIAAVLARLGIEYKAACLRQNPRNLVFGARYPPSRATTTRRRV